MQSTASNTTRPRYQSPIRSAVDSQWPCLPVGFAQGEFGSPGEGQGTDPWGDTRFTEWRRDGVSMHNGVAVHRCATAGDALCGWEFWLLVGNLRLTAATSAPCSRRLLLRRRGRRRTLRTGPVQRALGGKSGRGSFVDGGSTICRRVPILCFFKITFNRTVGRKIPDAAMRTP